VSCLAEREVLDFKPMSRLEQVGDKGPKQVASGCGLAEREILRASAKLVEPSADRLRRDVFFVKDGGPDPATIEDDKRKVT
jgi:hypothetical protein